MRNANDKISLKLRRSTWNVIKNIVGGYASQDIIKELNDQIDTFLKKEDEEIDNFFTWLQNKKDDKQPN